MDEKLKTDRNIIRDSFDEPEQDLERIKQLVKKSFPEVYQSIPCIEELLKKVPTARDSITKRINNYILSKSETIPISESDYAQQVQPITSHLAQQGIVTITKESEEVQAHCNGNSEISTGKRFALFTNNTLTGFLDFYQEQNEIWYQGKTPNKQFVRMIYAQGKREDAWDVPFVN